MSGTMPYGYGYSAWEEEVICAKCGEEFTILVEEETGYRWTDTERCPHCGTTEWEFDYQKAREEQKRDSRVATRT